jgi:hypothetical protein
MTKQYCSCACTAFEQSTLISYRTLLTHFLIDYKQILYGNRWIFQLSKILIAFSFFYSSIHYCGYFLRYLRTEGHGFFMTAFHWMIESRKVILLSHYRNLKRTLLVRFFFFLLECYFVGSNCCENKCRANARQTFSAYSV